MVLKVASGGPLNGPVYYQGTWDANANTPTLQSGVGFTGEYYIVSVAGNTTLDGISNWQVGDWAIFNGATNKWEKIDGGSYGTTMKIVNDTSSNTTYNIALTSSSGGLIDTEYVDNGALTFNPSTQVLTAKVFQSSAVSLGKPNFYATNTSSGVITFYDNLDPDAGVYNYRMQFDDGYTVMTMSTVNSPNDVGNIVFGLNQYGSVAFSGTQDNIGQISSLNFGSAGQVLTSNGASAAAYWSTPANGTVVSISAGTGITATPNPITSSGTIAIANTTVTAGTYGSSSAVAQVTINAQGQVTSASNVGITIPSGNVTGLGTMATQNANSVTITGGSISNVTLSNVSINTSIVTKTGNYTAAAADETILVNASGGVVTITLPTAVGVAGKVYTVKKIDSSTNAVTVATTSSQTIDGVTTYSLANQYGGVNVQSDGSNWYIIGNIFGRNGTTGTF
jgi:hypothetical protein